MKYSTNLQCLGYREERVRIRNSEIDCICRMRMYDNLKYQLIVRFERNVSGRFSPVTRPPAPLPLIRFSGPLRSIFCSRSAHMLGRRSTTCASARFVPADDWSFPGSEDACEMCSRCEDTKHLKIDYSKLLITLLLHIGYLCTFI